MHKELYATLLLPNKFIDILKPTPVATCISPDGRPASLRTGYTNHVNPETIQLYETSYYRSFSLCIPPPSPARAPPPQSVVTNAADRTRHNAVDAYPPVSRGSVEAAKRAGVGPDIHND